MEEWHIFVVQDLYIHYELRCLSNACQFQIQSRALEGMSLERNGKQEQPHICVYGPKISNSVSIIGSMHMTVYFSCNLVSPSSWEQGNIEERSQSLFEITISPFVLYRSYLLSEVAFLISSLIFLKRIAVCFHYPTKMCAKQLS